MTRVTLFVCALLAVGATGADAGVTRIEIERREVFAGGHAFGAVGTYENERIVEQAAATAW